VLNRYLLATGRAEDFDGLATLPFYLSMRAAIRAKVTAARLQSSTAEKKDDIAKVARKYFDLARELIEPPPPLLIAVGGLSGTGKSALARALAPGLGAAPGAVVLRSDIERKTLFGKDERDKLPTHAYAPDVTARVYATIADKARRAAAAGHCAIVDGVFAKPQERVVMERSASALAVPFHGLFLDADLVTRVARVGGRSGDASDADAAVARTQESYDLGALDWVRVDASGNPDETLARARAAIERSARSADTP
jgi:uncharacterized protein